MSQENVEIVRRFTETMDRGDYEGAAAMLAPDFTVDDTDIPESTGTDSFNAWIGRWDAAWESWRIENLAVEPIGEDRVMATFKMIVRGKGSGVELSREDASISDLRDGKIVRIAYYNDQTQALEAAGLSE